MITLITSFARPADAQSFGQKVLKEKLAACCSVFPGATSMYHWKGKDVVTPEAFLLIKTTQKKINDLKKFFKKNHPYELPEFFYLKATASAKFGAWIESQVK